jgi:hypothetical protein
MHSFQLPALRTHFSKTPNPPAVTAMVARDQFFDTAEEITVIAAAIYVLSVEYDQLEKRPQDSEHLRRWIILRRQPVVESLLYRVEPPFSESRRQLDANDQLLGAKTRF